MSRGNWALLISGCMLVGGCAPQPQPVAETATIAETKPVEAAPAGETAAPAADSTAKVETAPAGTMALTPANAQIQFIGKHTDDKPDRIGVFTEFTGQAAIDPATNTLTAVSVDIPISSVATAFDKLTDHLKSPDFFDAREHPTAKFESTSIAAGEKPGQQVVNGKLTLMGTTKDVSFPAEVAVADGAVKLTGHLTIKRSEYGMNKMLEGVKDDIDINVSIGEPTQKPTGG